jgi:hypothetical protein
MTRLARGSLPWPARLVGEPACRGSLTVDTPIDAGARLCIMASRGRTARPGSRSSLSLVLIAAAGATAHKTVFR